jgi:IS30 family transposase
VIMTSPISMSAAIAGWRLRSSNPNTPLTPSVRAVSRALLAWRKAVFIDVRGAGVEIPMAVGAAPEISDRAVPGHWEGDLLMGTRDSAIATLVERQTRYCQLVALPEETNAEPVCEALKASITTLPVQLRRSLTWDQGKEMAEHRRFSVETGVEVYFCDPRSPWQRGSNENTNGLLRQYFPKGKTLAGVTQAELDEVARKLNDRPRQTLGFRTPAEKSPS